MNTVVHDSQNVTISFLIKNFHKIDANVRSTNFTYKAKVIAPPLLNIEVNPRNLKFTQKRSFTLNTKGVINWNIVSTSLV